MKIYIGADHGGFALKQEIRPWLEVEGHEVEDLGAHELNPTDDYPDFSLAVAKAVAEDLGSNEAENKNNQKPSDSLGILICRSGGGAATVANKVPSIRAVHVYDVQTAVHTKEDNNANVITLGADFHGGSLDEAKRIIEAFLHTEFSDAERHLRRIQKISDYENTRN